MIKRATVASLAVALAAALAWAPGAGAGPKKKPKHDLSVLQVDNKDLVISPDPIEVSYAVKNVGRKAARGATVKVRFFKVSGTLPANSPTFTETLDGLFYRAGDRVDDVAQVSVPLGRWQPEVCVKFRKDKRKRNDCKRGDQFSVIPLAWRGAASWSTELGSGSLAEDANAPDALFAYERRTEEGFEYTGSGRVTYSTSGTDLTGCTHSGSKAYDIPPDSTLVLSEDLLTYRAEGLRQPSHTYQVNKTCPPPQFSANYTGPFMIPAWIQTGIKPKAADATTISGSNTLFTTFGGAWAWSFDAQ